MAAKLAASLEVSWGRGLWAVELRLGLGVKLGLEFGLGLGLGWGLSFG